jgi:hypothetical protein
MRDDQLTGALAANDDNHPQIPQITQIRFRALTEYVYVF